MAKWEDVSDVLTAEGANKVQVGQVLVFDFEGSKIRLKIRRKSKGKVWAERVELYTEDEVQKMSIRERKEKS